MIIDYTSVQNFLDNFYDIFLNNKLKFLRNGESCQVFLDPYGNKVKLAYRESGRVFEINCSLNIIIPTIKRNVSYDAKPSLETANKSSDFFTVTSKTKDLSEFLDTVSTQLKNEEMVQKISPFLDYLAIQKHICSFVSYKYGEFINKSPRNFELPEERIFQKVYQDLFGQIRYIFDEKRNLLLDNHSFHSHFIKPLEYSTHQILESKIYFEDYISKKPQFINLYSRVNI